jgi:hypothetical protein
MSDVLQGALIALAGVVVGIIGQAVIASRTFRGEKRWVVADEKRDHLEKTWVAIAEINDTYTTISSAARVYISNPTPATRDQYMAKSARIPWANADMLVNLYLPHLSDDLRAYNQLGLEATNVILEELQRVLDGTSNATEAAARIEAYGSKMISSVVELRHKLRAESGKIESERRRLSE